MKIKLRQRYSLQQRIIFFRQLAVILQSGLPILRGLALLEHHADKKIRMICCRLQNSLRRGKSMAAAMEEEGDFFPTLAVKLAAAGEESGKLHIVLGELAAYYQKQWELQSFIIKSLLYPVFLLLASAAVLLIFAVFVLPVLVQSYTAMGIKLSPALQFVIILQEYMMNFPSLAIAEALSGAYLLFLLGRALWRAFLRSSLSGNFHSLLLEVRFCKLLALLLTSGIQITQAVAIAAETVEDAGYARQLNLLNVRLRRGVAIEACADAAIVFSPLLLELVCVGASTGYLPQMLNEAAALGAKRLEEQLGRFKQLFVPFILLLAAVTVAGVVMTVVGPLFTMLSALPE